MSTKFKLNQPGKSAAALLLCGLVLFVSLLAVSPALHQLVHADADSPDHHCVVTLFAHGQLTPAPETQILAVILALIAVLVSLPQSFLLPSADYRFSTSRAPPVSRLV